MDNAERDVSAISCYSCETVLICDTNVAVAAAVAAIAEVVGAPIHAGLYTRLTSVSRPAVDAFTTDTRLFSLHRAPRLGTSLGIHAGPNTKTMVIVI